MENRRNESGGKLKDKMKENFKEKLMLNKDFAYKKLN